VGERDAGLHAVSGGLVSARFPVEALDQPPCIPASFLQPRILFRRRVRPLLLDPVQFRRSLVESSVLIPILPKQRASASGRKQVAAGEPAHPARLAKFRAGSEDESRSSASSSSCSSPPRAGSSSKDCARSTGKRADTNPPETACKRFRTKTGRCWRTSSPGPSRLRGRVSFLGIVVVLFFSSQSRLVVEGLRAV
jgi:hypothetical protein